MGSGSSIVGLDFDATVAWPIYDWMGVAKAALESVSRYLARDLGPRGIRVNLVSAGPLGTVAARGIPGSSGLAELWRAQAPLGWDVEDPAPVADTICFLLSDYARAISGEIVHVDGGFHAVGAPFAGLAASAFVGRSGGAVPSSLLEVERWLANERAVRVSALLGALAIAFSSILVRLSHASPSTAAIFRCAFALPVLGLPGLARGSPVRPACRGRTGGWPWVRACSSRPT